MRVAVGDTLEVVFSNTLEFDATLTPSGLELNDNDTDPVGTNETKTYSWNITDRVWFPLMHSTPSYKGSLRQQSGCCQPTGGVSVDQ